MEHNDDEHVRKYIRYRDGIVVIAARVMPVDDLGTLLEHDLVQFWAEVVQKEPAEVALAVQKKVRILKRRAPADCGREAA